MSTGPQPLFLNPHPPPLCPTDTFSPHPSHSLYSAPHSTDFHTASARPPVARCRPGSRFKPPKLRFPTFKSSDSPLGSYKVVRLPLLSCCDSGPDRPGKRSPKGWESGILIVLVGMWGKGEERWPVN